jgi:hypothetical protein
MFLPKRGLSRRSAVSAGDEEPPVRGKEMTSRERITAALGHREADRVPLFEIAVSNQVAEHFLGEKVFVWGTGATTVAAIEAEMRGASEYRKFMFDCFDNALRIYHLAGLDMIPIYPTAFVTPLNFGLHNVAVRDIYDVDITRDSPVHYTMRSKSPDAPGFWCSCVHSPESDTFQMECDSILEQGEEEFVRFVDYLENRALSNMPDPLQYGLDALEHAVEVNSRNYDLFLLGFADIQYPCFNTYHALFLTLMATNGELVHRYMRATTDSMKAMLDIELQMGVDGIIGANDWAYRSGPMMSPAYFDEYMAPYLKELVDLTHSYGKPYVKHLDGNTYPILPSLINTCGIDAYHAIEETAGMNIGEVKRLYGDTITLIGNIDCGEILTNGSVETIREETRRIIHTVSAGGGHIFGSSNAIHGGVPVENFLAYVNAAKEFGTYPIA